MSYPLTTLAAGGLTSRRPAGTTAGGGPPTSTVTRSTRTRPSRRTLLLCVAPGLVSNDRLSGLKATLQTTRVNVPGAGKP